MPEAQRFKPFAAVYVLVLRGDEVLLVRRANSGFWDGAYTLPSGHIEGGEPLTMAATRETREECGVTAAPGDLRLVHTMHRMSGSDQPSDAREYVDFYFAVSRWEGEPRVTESDKCDEVRWASLDALPKTVIPYVRQVLADYRAGRPFSEIGWAVENAPAN